MDKESISNDDRLTDELPPIDTSSTFKDVVDYIYRRGQIAGYKQGIVVAKEDQTYATKVILGSTKFAIGVIVGTVVGVLIAFMVFGSAFN